MYQHVYNRTLVPRLIRSPIQIFGAMWTILFSCAVKHQSQPKCRETVAELNMTPRYFASQSLIGCTQLKVQLSYHVIKQHTKYISITYLLIKWQQKEAVWIKWHAGNIYTLFCSNKAFITYLHRQESRAVENCITGANADYHHQSKWIWRIRWMVVQKAMMPNCCLYRVLRTIQQKHTVWRFDKM